MYTKECFILTIYTSLFFLFPIHKQYLLERQVMICISIFLNGLYFSNKTHIRVTQWCFWIWNMQNFTICISRHMNIIKFVICGCLHVVYVVCNACESFLFVWLTWVSCKSNIHITVPFFLDGFIGKMNQACDELLCISLFDYNKYPSYAGKKNYNPKNTSFYQNEKILI